MSGMHREANARPSIETWRSNATARLSFRPVGRFFGLDVSRDRRAIGTLSIVVRCFICTHERREALEIEGAIAMRAPAPDLALIAVAKAYRVSAVTLAEHVMAQCGGASDHELAVRRRARAATRPSTPATTSSRCHETLDAGDDELALLEAATEGDGAPDETGAARAGSCRCCKHTRRADLERDAMSAVDVEERCAIALRYGVTRIALDRHIDRHDSVSAAAAARTNIDALRIVIERAADPRDVALELLEVLAADRAATAVAVARLTAAPPSSPPRASTMRPRLACACDSIEENKAKRGRGD